MMLSRDAEGPGKWMVLDDVHAGLAALPMILLHETPPADDCPICYESLVEIFDEAQGVVKLPQCGHVFCKTW
ncbi:uncharacterized protein B0H18DRAFT_1015488 [Fomitopsis serialis]|uniref:uncharacterized protein n=1 Tax=Fomitopsis serialis TaxID=139415 RepID=UPI002008D7EE|nr:uncharacterized protein B0H18DRAFT_1015488 [Neoantrodia serialis]KAH9923259.1 hypothetical protein B0H18DRAFT_1015488 [Neoantrodia serialis]